MNFGFLKKSIVTLAIASISNVAFAANPYVDCGIGAALFPDTHWAAVSSNVIWDLGSTAVTSATASPNTCSNKNNMAAVYVRDTYAQIIEEAVKGETKHLTAALNIIECGVSHSVATEKVRNEIGQFISSKNYQQKPHLDKSSDLFNAIDSACKS